MNREYTSRVLKLLRNYVEQKISLINEEIPENSMRDEHSASSAIRGG